MTQALNLCRQFVKQLTPMLEGVKRKHNLPKTVMEASSYYGSLIDLVGLSQKIILPVNGAIFEDDSLRALDENSPLKLPYPVTVLEYLLDEGPPRPGALTCTKVIVVARERDFEADGGRAIVISVIPCYKHDGSWSPLPEVAIPITNAVDRKALLANGQLGIKFFTTNTPGQHVDDFRGEVSALLGVMNALACSNVGLTKLPQSNTRKAIKTALPFDEYHVLEVKQPTLGIAGVTVVHHAGRHPREHLRRGHIRCLETGRKIWVNACVVAAGTVGKVTKDYLIRKHA